MHGQLQVGTTESIDDDCLLGACLDGGAVAVQLGCSSFVIELVNPKTIETKKTSFILDLSHHLIRDNSSTLARRPSHGHYKLFISNDIMDVREDHNKLI
jgi:hypothetical protein